MALKLYKLDISPPVCATLMLIDHLKVSPIEFVDVDLLNKDHLTPEYLEYAAIFEGVRKPSEKAINDLLETYDFLEAFLSKTKFVAGDKMTIADISVLSTIAASRYMVPIDDKKYPKILAWLSYMEQQPFFKKYGETGSIGLGNILKEKLDI